MGVIGALLVSGSMIQSYNLVFDHYASNYTQSAWNTAEMGQVVKSFVEIYGSIDTAHVVPYPYWVDTRLVGINAGYPTLDMAMWSDHFTDQLNDPRAKLFIINLEDTTSIDALKKLYPSGALWKQNSTVDPSKDFFVFLVPPVGGAGQ